MKNSWLTTIFLFIVSIIIGFVSFFSFSPAQAILISVVLIFINMIPIGVIYSIFQLRDKIKSQRRIIDELQDKLNRSLNKLSDLQDESRVEDERLSDYQKRVLRIHRSHDTQLLLTLFEANSNFQRFKLSTREVTQALVEALIGVILIPDAENERTFGISFFEAHKDGHFVCHYYYRLDTPSASARKRIRFMEDNFRWKDGVYGLAGHAIADNKNKLLSDLSNMSHPDAESWVRVHDERKGGILCLTIPNQNFDLGDDVRSNIGVFSIACTEPNYLDKSIELRLQETIVSKLGHILLLYYRDLLILERGSVN